MLLMICGDRYERLWLFSATIVLFEHNNSAASFGVLCHSRKETVFESFVAKARRKSYLRKRLRAHLDLLGVDFEGRPRKRDT